MFQLHERQREIANPLSRVRKDRNDALYPLSIVGSHKMRVAGTDDRRASAVEFRAIALTPDVGSKRSVPGSGVSVVVERFANGLKCGDEWRVKTRDVEKRPVI